MPAKSKAQQAAAGAALAAKRAGKVPSNGAAKSMMSMSTKELREFAKGSTKGKPKGA